MEPDKIEENQRLEIEENYHGWKIWLASDNGCCGWIISKQDEDGQEIEYWDDYGNYSQPKSALIAARRCCLRLKTFLAMNQVFLELRNLKKLSRHEYDALYDSLFSWVYEEN